MNKLTKEAFKKVLSSPIIDCTENEIRFVFNMLQLSLKEYKGNDHEIEFEVHWRRTYIIKVAIEEGVLTFSNEWIAFNEQKAGLAFECPNKLIEIISLMFFLFGDPIFNTIDYAPGFIKGYSYVDSTEEGQEYWDIMHAMIEESYAGVNKINQTAPKIAAPSKKDYPALNKDKRNFS